MRAIRTAMAAALLAAVAATLPVSADYLVKEVGSFHVGGRTETLSGPADQGDRVHARLAADQGRSERRVRGRADVRAVRQAGPAARQRCRCCSGMAAASPASPGRPSRTASRAGSSSSSMPAMTSTSPMRSSAAAPRGRAIRKSSRASRCSAPRRRPGSCSASGRATRSAASARRSRASSSRSRRSTSSCKQGVPRWVDQRRGDADGLRRAGAEGLPVHHRGAQPGRQFRLHGRAQCARQGQGADRGRAVGRSRPGKVDAAKLKGVPHLIVWGDFHRQARGVAAASRCSIRATGRRRRGRRRQGRYVRLCPDGHQGQHPHDDDGPQFRRHRQADQRLDRQAGPDELSVPTFDRRPCRVARFEISGASSVRFGPNVSPVVVRAVRPRTVRPRLMTC